MSLTLKQVFDEHFAKTKFDGKFVKAIYQYQIGYVNRNPEHMEFFGSSLLGVHVVRFKDSDIAMLFDEVFDVDYHRLTSDIRKVPTIDHNFKVAGDVFNLTMMYVIHRCLTSPVLSDQQRHRAAYDSALIFFYRCIAAIQSYNFRYPADPRIAQAAYAKLSEKYLIKKLGTWHRVMDYRAEDLISKDSIHLKDLLKFTDDLATVYAISDSQGRIRDLYKNYYAVFAKVHTDGDSIAVTSGTWIDAEGEETIKEKTRSTEAYVNYMRNAIVDRHTFVRDELVGVIVKINSNTSFRMVKQTLMWMQEHYSEGKDHKLIDEFMSLVIVQSLYLIQNNMESKHMRDYPYILATLKNLHLSTRTTDPEVEKIRELGFDIVRKANGRVSDSLTLATRTSVILYLTLRALVGQTRTAS